MAITDQITVDLGGERREIRLNQGAVRYAQITQGVDFSLQDMAESPMSYAPKAVWISLLPDHNDLTQEQVALWMANLSNEDEKRIVQYITRQLTEAMDVYGEALDEVKKSRAYQMGEEDRQEITQRVIDALQNAPSENSTS